MSGQRKMFASVLSPYTTSAFIGGQRRLVDCADAKKLTLLARRIALRVNIGQTSSQLPPPPKKSVCVVCIKRGGRGLRTHLRSCRICGMPICSKCQVKNKRVFLGVGRPWSVVPCCPMCLLKAQRMTDLRPSESEFGVVADYFIKQKSSSPRVTTASTSFCASFVAACDESNDTNAMPSGLVPWNSVKEINSADCFSDSLSQICLSSVGSNEFETDDEEEARIKGDAGLEEAGQLPDVAEELLWSGTKVDCQREQLQLTKRYLQGEPSSMSTRITIAGFRGAVPVLMSSSDEVNRARNRSDGCEELAAKLQELQITADQTYGDVVARNMNKQQRKTSRKSVLRQKCMYNNSRNNFKT